MFQEIRNCNAKLLAFLIRAVRLLQATLSYPEIRERRQAKNPRR